MNETMTVIDQDEAIRILEDVVRVMGRDYEQDVCEHFDAEGAPRCIAGYAMRHAGYQGGREVGAFMNENTQRNLRNAGIDLTDEGLAVWSTAQLYADRRWVWGEVLDAVKESFSE